MNPKGIFGLLLFLICPQSIAAEKFQDRPNIVFIFTDDQAPWALGLSGHPHASTPHLDKLFKSGAYLTNAFTTTPVCSPSRVGLLTGRYGSEMGITDWLNPRKEPKGGLKSGTLTWPKLLQQAGYRTGLVGKWHIGLLDEMHPTKFGYDYFMGFRGGGNSPKDPTLEKDGKTSKFKGLTPDILTNHALEFVKESKGKPFCLSLHFRAPHARWLPVADEDWEPFKSLDPMIPNPKYPKLNIERVKKMTREYLASVKSVDRNVGRLLAHLKKNKLEQNTIVIFSSDHGYNMGHNGIWHKGNGHWVLTQPPLATKNIPRGQRPNMYDHSIRVPTAIRWPGVIKPGTVIKETISNLDWFPTLLAMANVSVPTDAKLRGHNFSSLLNGDKSIEWNNDFYAEYSTKHQSHTHMRMYRTSKWKLVRDFLNPERDELYNLEKDPQEQRNLIHAESVEITRVTAQLHKKIIEKMREINDPILKKVTK